MKKVSSISVLEGRALLRVKVVERGSLMYVRVACTHTLLRTSRRI